MKRTVALTVLLITLLPGAVWAADAPPPTGRIKLQRDDRQGQLHILLDGKEALVYCYGKDVDLPHYYPVRSPSGRLLTVQQPRSDHKHHRSVWFADEVQLNGQRKVSFYKAIYSRTDPKDPTSPLRDRIRHVKFLEEEVTPARATIKAQLLWEADQGKMPVLDEIREMRVVPLENGEYFLDLQFEVKAAYGDVTFVSNKAEYAWPYVRMNSKFSGQQGGVITNSEGGVNEKGTHDKPARWVDYSNTVDGAAEGLAMFIAAEKEPPPRWLTREYGPFGPRRADAQNGKPFTLKKGDSLTQRVGILVHSGDVNAGRVKERCRQYMNGKLGS